MFDGLGIGMGFFELLRGAFDVGTEVFELGSHPLLERELLHVDRVVRVGGDGRVGVLLPCEGLGPADDDFEAVVLDRAGEVGRLALLFDERLHSGFHLRTERFQRLFGFVTCYLRSEKLVNNVVVLLCVLRLIVVSIHCFNDYVNRATPFSMAIALRIAA